MLRIAEHWSVQRVVRGDKTNQTSINLQIIHQSTLKHSVIDQQHNGDNFSADDLLGHRFNGQKNAARLMK
jgi:hypothetical protein